jgi:hypothetical protein
MFLQTNCNTLPHTWNHLISHFLTNPHRGTYSIDPFEGCLGNCGVRLCNECPEASALHRTATHCNTLHTTQCNTHNNPHHTVIQRASTQSSHVMQHTMSRILWCILFVHRHCQIDPPHHQMYANLNRAGSMKTNNTLSLSLSLSFSLSHTHTLSLTHTHSHTHTHTLAWRAGCGVQRGFGRRHRQALSASVGNMVAGAHAAFKWSIYASVQALGMRRGLQVSPRRYECLHSGHL